MCYMKRDIYIFFCLLVLYFFFFSIQIDIGYIFNRLKCAITQYLFFNYTGTCFFLILSTCNSSFANNFSFFIKFKKSTYLYIFFLPFAKSFQPECNYSVNFILSISKPVKIAKK